jgi:DNA modification methylase
MDVVETPIDKLVPYARNPRRNEEAVATVAASLAEFGWRQPIVVDEDMVIVVGHTRYEAAKRLGMTSVPVHVAHGLTPAQLRAYRLMDNRSHQNASWDDELLKLELADLKLDEFDLALTGFEDDELARLLAEAPVEGLVDEDDVPEPPATPVTRRGDLWILGEHRLLCGDSTSAEDVIRLMNGERAALFATDPPYLVDYDGTNHPTKKNASARAKKIANKDWSDDYIEQKHWDDSSQGPQFYEAFIQVAIDCAIKEDAAWYCWHASRRQAMLEACWSKFDVLHHQQIIWAKSRPVLTRSIMLWAHEPCLFGWRSGNKPRVNREGFENWPTTVWSIPSSEIETREHPTSKPVRVFTLPMELHTVPGEICYEPFSGSGSQHIAGEKTGRRVYGLELSETFCDVVVNRWQAFSGKTAILDDDGRTFAQVKAERLDGDAEALADANDTDADREPARKRKTAA